MDDAKDAKDEKDSKDSKDEKDSKDSKDESDTTRTVTILQQQQTSSPAVVVTSEPTESPPVSIIRTEMPTTEMPTEMPTTEMPTEMPTAEMPTTDIPTTMIPSTENPDTAVPLITSSPTVQNTEVPTSESPVNLITEVPQIATTEVPQTTVPDSPIPSTLLLEQPVESGIVIKTITDTWVIRQPQDGQQIVTVRIPFLKLSNCSGGVVEALRSYVEWYKIYYNPNSKHVHCTEHSIHIPTPRLTAVSSSVVLGSDVELEVPDWKIPINSKLRNQILVDEWLLIERVSSTAKIENLGFGAKIITYEVIDTENNNESVWAVSTAVRIHQSVNASEFTEQNVTKIVQSVDSISNPDVQTLRLRLAAEFIADASANNVDSSIALSGINDLFSIHSDNDPFNKDQRTSRGLLNAALRSVRKSKLGLPYHSEYFSAIVQAGQNIIKTTTAYYSTKLSSLTQNDTIFPEVYLTSRSGSLLLQLNQRFLLPWPCSIQYVLWSSSSRRWEYGGDIRIPRSVYSSLQPDGEDTRSCYDFTIEGLRGFNVLSNETSEEMINVLVNDVPADVPVALSTNSKAMEYENILVYGGGIEGEDDNTVTLPLLIVIFLMGWIVGVVVLHRADSDADQLEIDVPLFEFSEVPTFDLRDLPPNEHARPSWSGPELIDDEKHNKIAFPFFKVSSLQILDRHPLDPYMRRDKIVAWCLSVSLIVLVLVLCSQGGSESPLTAGQYVIIAVVTSVLVLPLVFFVSLLFRRRNVSDVNDEVTPLSVVRNDNANLVNIHVLAIRGGPGFLESTSYVVGIGSLEVSTKNGRLPGIDVHVPEATLFSDPAGESIPISIVHNSSGKKRHICTGQLVIPHTDVDFSSCSWIPLGESGVKAKISYTVIPGAGSKDVLAAADSMELTKIQIIFERIPLLVTLLAITAVISGTLNCYFSIPGMLITTVAGVPSLSPLVGMALYTLLSVVFTSIISENWLPSVAFIVLVITVIGSVFCIKLKRRFLVGVVLVTGMTLIFVVILINYNFRPMWCVCSVQLQLLLCFISIGCVNSPRRGMFKWDSILHQPVDCASIGCCVLSATIHLIVLLSYHRDLDDPFVNERVAVGSSEVVAIPLSFFTSISIPILLFGVLSDSLVVPQSISPMLSRVIHVSATGVAVVLLALTWSTSLSWNSDKQTCVIAAAFVGISNQMLCCTVSRLLGKLAIERCFGITSLRRIIFKLKEWSSE